LGGLRLQGLTAQGGVERAHGGADLGRIAAGVGRVKRFGGVDDRAVVGTHGACSLRAVSALALEGFVQRGAENFPQFLFGLAVQGNGLRFGLPTLLQGLDGIHAQGRSSQLFGFTDQRVTAFDAGFLGGLQAFDARQT
jgi:hypothetical protein